MGVASGRGCKEVYRFPHTILIPTPLACSFLNRCKRSRDSSTFL